MASRRCHMSDAQPNVPRVALLVETSKSYGRGVLRGISRWVRDHGPWTLYADERGLEDRIPRRLEATRFSGVISRLRKDRLPAAWRRSKLPVVFLRREDSGAVERGVYSDEAAIAVAAASHLVDQGFRHLAFCGVATTWSNLRQQAFCERAAQCRVTVDAFSSRLKDSPGMHPDDVPSLARWIESLPKPVGVMAAYDVRALEVLEATRVLGLDVPDDIAIIGVDDDEVLCELGSPHLSSVAHNLQCIGYEAARMLAADMAGVSIHKEAVFVPPMGVTVRRSTDILAIDDPDLRRALRLIRARACHRLSPDDVADATALSRRSLDRHFTKHIGRSIHDEIVRTKLLASKRLLAETDLKVSAIASRCDFGHAAQFCNVFKKAFGVTPTEYRRQCRPWA